MSGTISPLDTDKIEFLTKRGLMQLYIPPEYDLNENNDETIIEADTSKSDNEEIMEQMELYESLN